MKTQKLWGSAFEKPPSEKVIDFTAGRDVKSIKPSDENLIEYDILVNKAHCKMLAKQGIISQDDSDKILAGLDEYVAFVETRLIASLQNDKPILDPTKEDVHTNIESWLTDKIGIEVAGKLHTARSRNDQVATDMKLYLRDEVNSYVSNLENLISIIEVESQKHKNTLMPGFTHHQHAMVTTFGKLLNSYEVMLKRDIQKLQNWTQIHNKCPLGNMAGYETSFPIDREFTAKELGFEGPDNNSIDAVTNRGEAEADFAYTIISIMNHLSQIAQTLILMSTPQFNMVKLADEYSTGSSVMPQKKNPDPLEVIKGKTAFAAGQLQSLIGINQSNFMGYNRDSQWTKYIIMDLISECKLAPEIVGGVISTLTVNKDVMEKWCHKNFIGATTLMEQVSINFNIPFRQAKVITEKAIKYSGDKDRVTFEALQKSLEEKGNDIEITKEQVELWQDPGFLF